MARIELGLHLDRDDGSYQPDEEISGEVVVRTPEPCRSRRLSVGLGVVARSRPPVAHTRERVGVVEKVLLAENVQWRAGETRRFPFRLTPQGLVRSYAGSLMNLQPFLQASTAVTRSEAREIQVAPRRDRGLHVAWAPGDLSPQQLRWVPVVAALVVAAAGSVVWGAMQANVGLILASVFVLVIGGIGLVVGLRTWLSQLRTGAVRVVLEPVPAAGGGREGIVALRVSLRAPSATAIGGAPRASIVVREWVRRVTSDARPVWTHELFRADAELGAADGPGHYVGEVRLPEAGSIPYDVLVGDAVGGSVGASGYAIQWELKAEIPVDGGVDWQRSIPLRARPIDVPFERSGPSSGR